MVKKAKQKSPLLGQSNAVIINRLFLIAFAICAFLSAELAALTRGDSLQDMFFWNDAYSDHFMDFFNTIRDSSDLTWVYQRSTIYPPLSVLLMHMFASMIPSEQAKLPFADRYEMQMSQICVVLFFMVAFVSVLLLAKMIDRYMEKAGVDRWRYLLIFFLIISFPVTYCLERGNTSLIALVGCAFFLFFRNSENKVVRELSYLALALAAGLKMFPAVLGIILIYDKQYKAAARTIVYGVAAILLPYLLVKLITPETGGIASQIQAGLASGELDPEVYNTDGSVGRLFTNLLKWANKRSYFTFNSTSAANIAYFLGNANVISSESAQTFGIVLFLVTEAIALIAGFFCKKEWQKIFIVCYLMLNVHAVAMFYTLIYVIPAFVAFLCDPSRKNKRSKKALSLDIVYLILFGIQIIPLPYILRPFQNYVDAFIFVNFNVLSPNNLNQSLSCIAFQLIFVVLLIEWIATALKEKKRNKNAAKKKDLEKTAVMA